MPSPGLLLLSESLASRCAIAKGPSSDFHSLTHDRVRPDFFASREKRLRTSGKGGRRSRAATSRGRRRGGDLLLPAAIRKIAGRATHAVSGAAADHSRRGGHAPGMMNVRAISGDTIVVSRRGAPEWGARGSSDAHFRGSPPRVRARSREITTTRTRGCIPEPRTPQFVTIFTLGTRRDVHGTRSDPPRTHHVLSSAEQRWPRCCASQLHV